MAARLLHFSRYRTVNSCSNDISFNKAHAKMAKKFNYLLILKSRVPMIWFSLPHYGNKNMKHLLALPAFLCVPPYIIRWPHSQPSVCNPLMLPNLAKHRLLASIVLILLTWCWLCRWSSQPPVRRMNLLVHPP